MTPHNECVALGHEPSLAKPRRFGAPWKVNVAPVTFGVINVSNLRLRTFVGFNPEERAKRQDVVINLEISHRLNPGVLDDRVEDALDYKRITKAVIERVENGRFLLLEKLASEVLAICSEHPQVERAKVRVDKPHALRFADSVSLALRYDAVESDSLEEKST